MSAVADQVETTSAEPEPETTPKKRGGGPKTQEGRDRAKRNSCIDGLMAVEVFPDDLAAAVKQCIAAMVDQFQPTSTYELKLLADMGRATAQIELCEEQKIVNWQRLKDRAVLCWDSDRRAAIDVLGAKLPRDHRIARVLKGSKQGVDWCIQRWKWLAESLEANLAWSEAQRQVAFDLRGIPAEFRDSTEQVPSATDVDALAALVVAEIGRLRALQETSLFDLDAEAQRMAAAGMLIEEDAATRRLHRCETRARRVLTVVRDELLRVRAGGVPAVAAESASSSSPPSPAAEERSIEGPAAGDDPPRRDPEVVGSVDAAEVPAELPALTVEASSVAEPPADVEPPAIVEPPAVVEVPSLAETPALVPPPVRKSFVVLPTPVPKNRHQRRAKEKRARQAKHRGAR